MDNKLEKLNIAYQNNTLAPFFGAGVSIPFANISWGTLIQLIAANEKNISSYQDKLNQILNETRYFDALDFLKSNFKDNKFEKTVKRTVHKIYLQKQIEVKHRFSEIDNNYKDLLNIGFRLFFTFNYDHFFEGVAQDIHKEPHSNVLKEDIINTQFITQRNQDPTIWHIHGDFEKIDSIILSPKSYEKAYTDRAFQNKLSYLINHFVFLFLGVSFHDVAIQKFFSFNKTIFEKNMHYILFAEHEIIDEEELLHEYGLIVIRYNTSNGHVQGIRQVLNKLFQKEIQKEKNSNRVYHTNIEVNGGTSYVLNGDIQNFHAK